MNRILNTTLLLLFLPLVLLVTSCDHEDHDEHEEHTTFLVTTPMRTDTSVVQEYVCQIHAYQHIELRALERGYLEDILVDEGQRVRKGQRMFQIMPTIYQAEYKQAHAKARVAEIEYQNTKALADKNVVSQNELAMAEAHYEEAKAELSLAKAHLDFTQISAPFEGIMDRLHVRHGSLLEEGEMLASLSDNSAMWVYFNVPEAQYLNYRQETPDDSTMEVELKMANGQLFAHRGKVTAIEADFNNQTGNIAFRATFPNPERLLRHGETGTILVREILKNALIIPQKATFEILDKRFVYVVDADHKIHSREITVAAELQHLYVVEGGLRDGERILLDGIRKVKEGQEIHETVISPEKAIDSLELLAE